MRILRSFQFLQLARRHYRIFILAGIQVNDAASIMTEVNTIFLGDQDDRYVALRADRKEILKSMNTFIVERKALMALTQEQRDKDFEVEA